MSKRVTLPEAPFELPPAPAYRVSASRVPVCGEDTGRPRHRQAPHRFSFPQDEPTTEHPTNFNLHKAQHAAYSTRATTK